MATAGPVVDGGVKKNVQQVGKEKISADSNLHVQSIANSTWVLDCITGDPKKRITPQKVSDFMIPKSLPEDYNDERKDAFMKIFKYGGWPAKDPSYNGMQASGPGAMLRNAQGVMAALHSVLNRIKGELAKPELKLLDLPCGDMQWMDPFLNTRSDVQYTGMDIVQPIIRHHQKKYENVKRLRFVHTDIVNTPLTEAFDIILCRDMLQHLQIGDAMKALENFSGSGSKYLLVTTYPDTKKNANLNKEKRNFPYNLELSPFSLTPPLCQSYDWNLEHIALWALPLQQHA